MQNETIKSIIELRHAFCHAYAYVFQAIHGLRSRHGDLLLTNLQKFLMLQLNSWIIGEDSSNVQVYYRV